jgi:hypothetical protein
MILYQITDPDTILGIPLQSLQYHPCAVRHLNTAGVENGDKIMQKDLHNVVKRCQVHRHSKTCYKYWKGPPAPKEYRFDLDERNVYPLLQLTQK